MNIGYKRKDRTMSIPKKINAVKVEKKDIPNNAYEMGCRILDSSVRRLFEKAEVREEYEKWLSELENSVE